jgi:hypothetical protein
VQSLWVEQGILCYLHHKLISLIGLFKIRMKFVISGFIFFAHKYCVFKTYIYIYIYIYIYMDEILSSILKYFIIYIHAL